MQALEKLNKDKPDRHPNTLNSEEEEEEQVSQSQMITGVQQQLNRMDEFIWNETNLSKNNNAKRSFYKLQK